MTEPRPIDQFPIKSVDKLRYVDTDRQGHVNNTVFSTALETGRCEVLLAPDAPLTSLGCTFVIARLEIDYRAELNWPGEVMIGTTVESVGRSSLTLRQALFQNDVCVALARSVIVQMDETTRKSSPLSSSAIARLHEIQALAPAT